MSDAFEGKLVLVRCKDAGVHCGFYVAHSGREVILENARRIWRWEGANTCSELANNGCNENSRIAEPVEMIILTECCEIILCKAEAAETLTNSRWP